MNLVELLEYLIDREPLWVVVAFLGALALIYIGYRYAIYQIKVKEKRDQLALRQQEIDMDKTATFDRGEEISRAQRIVLLEQEIAALRLSKVTKADHDALVAQLQELSKNGVERAVFERLQADYDKLHNSSLEIQKERDTLTAQLSENAVEITLLNTMADRTQRAEEAYDLLKSETDSKILTQDRTIKTLRMQVEAFNRDRNGKPTS